MAQERVKTLSVLQSNKQKARYTATLVACGWAGAVFEVTRAGVVRQKTEKKTNPKQTDGRDGPTDRHRGVLSRVKKKHIS